uniref:Nucleolar protein 10 n=1 Tax=Lygus hesperus TaxID=30085 RepID=A0A0A9XCY9_LYGHE
MEEVHIASNSNANLTQSHSDIQQNIYTDFTFVTRDDLDLVGLSHLLGTPAVRAYMHGYFIQATLYNKAREAYNAANKHQSQREYVDEKVQQEMDERRKQSHTINTVAKNTAQQDTSDLDPRFSRVLYDKDFTISTQSKYYKQPDREVVHAPDIIGSPLSSTSSADTSDEDTVHSKRKGRRNKNRRKSKESRANGSGGDGNVKAIPL